MEELTHLLPGEPVCGGWGGLQVLSAESLRRTFLLSSCWTTLRFCRSFLNKDAELKQDEGCQRQDGFNQAG